MTKHVVDTYKEWQPKYAAYDKWIKDEYREARREQAIKEMVSEAGEVLGVVTKAHRKEHHIPRGRVLDELSDTLWGLVGVMNEFDISWEEITQYNIKKLTERNQPQGETQ